MFKSKGGRVCIPPYKSNPWTKGGPLSHKQGWSHTPIWCGLAITLKINYYYYINKMKQENGYELRNKMTSKNPPFKILGNNEKKHLLNKNIIIH